MRSAFFAAAFALCGLSAVVAQAGPQAVVDANGAFIGSLVGVGQVAVTASASDRVSLPFDLVNGAAVPGAPSLLYTSANCTGTAYVNYDGAPQSEKGVTLAAGVYTITYATTSGATTIGANSVKNGGTCSMFGSTTNFFAGPAATFTIAPVAPYTLQ